LRRRRRRRRRGVAEKVVHILSVHKQYRRRDPATGKL